jgi:hypothetical protein
VELLKRKKYKLKNHRTLKEEVRKENNQREFKNKKRWRLFQHQTKIYPKYII